MSYLTEEQRKAPLNIIEEYFRFVTKTDLSGGIDVYPISEYLNLKKTNPKYSEGLSRDVAIFISYFMLFWYPTLNGFSGIDTFEWRFHDKPYKK